MKRKQAFVAGGACLLFVGLVVAGWGWLHEVQVEIPRIELAAPGDLPVAQLLRVVESVELAGEVTLTEGRLPLPKSSTGFELAVERDTHAAFEIGFSTKAVSDASGRIEPLLCSCEIRLSRPVKVQQNGAPLCEITSLDMNHEKGVVEGHVHLAVATWLSERFLALCFGPGIGHDVTANTATIQTLRLQSAEMRMIKDRQLALGQSQLLFGDNCTVRMKDVAYDPGNSFRRAAGKFAFDGTLAAPSRIATGEAVLNGIEGSLKIAGDFSLDEGALTIHGSEPCELAVRSGSFDLGQGEVAPSLHIPIRRFVASLADTRCSFDTAGHASGASFQLQHAELIPSKDVVLKKGRSEVVFGGDPTSFVVKSEEGANSTVRVVGEFPEIVVRQDQKRVFSADRAKLDVVLSTADALNLRGTMECSKPDFSGSASTDKALQTARVRFADLRCQIFPENVEFAIPDSEIRIARQLFFEAVRSQIPGEFPLANLDLGNPAIYQNVRFQNAKASNCQPAFDFRDGAFVFACTATISADLLLKYNHIVVNMVERESWTNNPLPGLFGSGNKIILARWKEPQVVSDWRDRGPLPNSLNTAVGGILTISQREQAALPDLGLKVDIGINSLEFRDAKLNTGDKAGELASAFLPLLANIEPWNSAIRKEMGSALQVKPFQNLTPADRESLQRFICSNLTIAADENDVVIRCSCQFRLDSHVLHNPQ